MLSSVGGGRVLFLGGLGRSGTTLIERLLDQVDGVAALGETVHLWERGVRTDERCGCGEPFSRCPFWTEVGRLAFGGWDRVDLSRVATLRARLDRLRRIPNLLRRPPEDLEEYVDLYRRVYAAAYQVSGASVLVDSSKHPAMAFCLALAGGVDLRAVHVVRDPRAVAHSWTKTVKRPEATVEDEVMTRYTPARAAALWDAENLAMSGLRRTGVPVLRLRYEDFVREPAVQLRRVLDAAGIASTAEMPVDGFTARLTPSHTASGNPMRFRNGELSIRRDDGWRDGLPARDRRVVTGLTWPLAGAYGYGATGAPS